MDITTTVDHVRTAELRFSKLPAEVIQAIDEMTSALVANCSGPETTESYDAIINEWLEPHGIAQRTVWDPTTRETVTELTTLEALAAGAGAPCK